MYTTENDNSHAGIVAYFKNALYLFEMVICQSLSHSHCRIIFKVSTKNINMPIGIILQKLQSLVK